jgi:hypothetical protein
LNYIDSEHDLLDPRAFGLTLQQFVAATGLPNTHVIGSWTTFDWQISYEIGKFQEIAPETPQPGYDKASGSLAKRLFHRSQKLATRVGADGWVVRS